jgi:hypothetical protein
MEPLLAFPFAGFHSPINLNSPIAKNALLVPQAAVIEVQSMYQMVVVTPDNKASFRPMKVGERVATNWTITEDKAGREGYRSGLHEGATRYPRHHEALCDCIRAGEQLTVSKFFINRPISSRSSSPS